MAWGKDKPFKEVFGMEESEMKEMITGAASKKDVEALTEKIAAFEDTTKDVKSIKEMLQALSENNRSNTNDGGDGGDGGGEPKPRSNKLISFTDDPDAAFAQRMAPVTGLALATRADYIFDRVIDSQKYGPVLKDEIKKILANEPLESRIKEDFVLNAYNIAVARNLESIQNDNNKREGKFFVEGGRSSSTTLDSSTKDKKPNLTDEEREYVKKFGMTEEQYVKTKGELKYV